MSVVSGTVGAVLSSDAQNKATKTNAKSAAEANRMNLLLNLFGRGAPLSGKDVPAALQGREAAILPYYFGDFEKTLSKDAIAAYLAERDQYGSPELELADYQRILDQYAPMFSQVDQTAGSIFSGDLTRERLGDAEPVFAQRVTGAKARRNAALESLRETLNEIDSIQAGKGFNGDSLGNKLTRFNARRSINTNASTDLNMALLENAMQTLGIKDDGRNLKLANLGLPDQLATAALNRKTLPTNLLNQRRNTMQQGLSFFNLGPHAFTPFQRAPSVEPNNAALLAVTGAQNAGSTVANYFLQKQLQNQIANRTSGTLAANAFAQPVDYGALAYGAGSPGGLTYADLAMNDFSTTPIY